MMNEQQRNAIDTLMEAPRDQRSEIRVSTLKAFGVTSTQGLPAKLLSAAISAQNGEDLELTLELISVIGLESNCEELLSRALEGDWHVRHEELVRLLVTLNSPSSIPALYRAATWVPSYLEYDDARAMASKAIHGLGQIPVEAATDALRKLAEGLDPVVAQRARHELEQPRTSDSGSWNTSSQ